MIRSHLTRTLQEVTEGYSISFLERLLDPWSSAGVYDDMAVIQPGGTRPWLRNLTSNDVSALILPLSHL